MDNNVRKSKRIYTRSVIKRKIIKAMSNQEADDSLYVPVVVKTFYNNKEYLNRFIFEFDNKLNSKQEPHFHIWKSNGEGVKVLNSRCVGLSVFSLFNGLSVHYVEKEQQDKKHIMEDERILIKKYIETCEELRFAMFVICYAQKNGYAITNLSLSMDELTIDMPDEELIKAKELFDKKITALKKQNQPE